MKEMREKIEIFKTVRHYLIDLFNGGSASYAASLADSGKCIWTGLNADRTYDRNNKNSSDQRSICFLIEIMPVMFIPAGVGLLEAWPSLRPVWIPVVVISSVTTIIVMVVTGRAAQRIIGKEKKEDGTVFH